MTPWKPSSSRNTPVTVPGEALSDFHVNVPALDPGMLPALREAKSLEATVDGQTIRFELNTVGAALDRLDAGMGISPILIFISSTRCTD